MAKAVKDGLSLLIGAGVGVGLMYLFDPELGEKRRKTISKNAGNSVSGATDAVQNFASTVSDHAPSLSSIGTLVSPAAGALKTAYEQLGEHLQGHLDQVHSKASDLHSKASDAIDDAQSAGQSAADGAKGKLRGVQTKLLKELSDRVSTLSGPAKDKYAKALKDLTLQLGRDEDHHYIGQTACALGSLALGAGAVYLLDPDKGHDRRDNLASTVTGAVNEVGTFFRKIGTRLIHQGQDLAGQAQDQIAPMIDKISDLKDQYTGGSKTDDSGYQTPSQSYASGQ